jgi:hypothetical protein
MANSPKNYGRIKITLGEHKVFEAIGEEKKIYKDLKEFIYNKS